MTILTSFVSYCFLAKTPSVSQVTESHPERNSMVVDSCLFQFHLSRPILVFDACLHGYGLVDDGTSEIIVKRCIISQSDLDGGHMDRLSRLCNELDIPICPEDMEYLANWAYTSASNIAPVMFKISLSQWNIRVQQNCVLENQSKLISTRGNSKYDMIRLEVEKTWSSWIRQHEQQKNSGSHNKMVLVHYDYDGKGGDTTCSVCLDGFKQGDHVAKTSCSHYFHQPCISIWVSGRRNNCPLCRSLVVVDVSVCTLTPNE